MFFICNNSIKSILKLEYNTVCVVMLITILLSLMCTDLLLITVLVSGFHFIICN